MNYSLGAGESWEAVVYGEVPRASIDFLAKQYDTYSAPLTEFGKKFFDSSKKAFSMFHSSEAMALARKALSKLDADYQTDHVMSFTKLSHFQRAAPVMQRWVMANPKARGMYHRQQCSGYQDSYHDHEPGLLGKDHFDYRRVVDGVMFFDEGGRGYYETHDEPGIEDCDRLMPAEQDTILLGWGKLEYLLAMGLDDPTSSEGEML